MTTKNISAKQFKYFPILFVMYEIASYLSNDAYLPAMPIIQEELHTNDDMVRLSLTAWFLGGCLIQLFVGPIADYIGRRKVLLSGGLVFVLSTIGCALSTSINWLNLFRFIEGMTIATMAVTGYATIHYMFDTKKSIQVIAFINSISVLAPAFGPLAGAVCLVILPWQAIFWVLAFWALVPLLLLSKEMPETAPMDSQPLQLSAVIKSYYKILSNIRFLRYLIAGRCIFAAMIIWLSAGPFLVYETFKLSTTNFGIAQVFVFGCYIAGTRLNKHMLDNYTLKTILWHGWGYCLLGCVFLIFCSLVAITNFYFAVPGLMLITFGGGLTLPIYSRLSVEQSDEPMGAKVSVSTFATTLFGVLATVLVNVYYYHSLWSMAVLLTGILCLGFAFFSIGRDPKS